MAANKHGFHCEEPTPDYILMGVEKEIVNEKANTLSYKEYLEYKLERMEKALAERVKHTDFTGESNSRMTFTGKAIAHTTKQLNQISKQNKHYSDQVTIEITEYDLEEFKKLLLENSVDSIDWTYITKNGTQLEIEFIKE